MNHGKKIVFEKNKLVVPNYPIIPFIEGDGIGPDIWKASQMVFDSAVTKAYGKDRSIIWKEIYAGEKAFELYKKFCRQDKGELDYTAIINFLDKK